MTATISAAPRFKLMNREGVSVLNLDDSGVTYLEGTSLTVGREDSNTSQIFLGTNKQWRLWSGPYSGSTAFELTDPLNRPRIRVYQQQRTDIQDSLSVFGVVDLGSSLSIYGPHMKCGGAMSILRTSSLGSTPSMRSLTRGGSALPTFGISRFGPTAPTFDFLHPGSPPAPSSSGRSGPPATTSGTA